MVRISIFGRVHHANLHISQGALRPYLSSPFRGAQNMVFGQMIGLVTCIIMNNKILPAS